VDTVEQMLSKPILSGRVQDKPGRVGIVGVQVPVRVLAGMGKDVASHIDRMLHFHSHPQNPPICVFLL
jgi:hypothetical protein